MSVCMLGEGLTFDRVFRNNGLSIRFELGNDAIAFSKETPPAGLDDLGLIALWPSLFDQNSSVVNDAVQQFINKSQAEFLPPIRIVTEFAESESGYFNRAFSSGRRLQLLLHGLQYKEKLVDDFVTFRIETYEQLVQLLVPTLEMINGLLLQYRSDLINTKEEQ